MLSQGKYLQSFVIKYANCGGIFRCFIRVKKFPSLPSLLRIFFVKGCNYILSSAFGFSTLSEVDHVIVCKSFI